MESLNLPTSWKRTVTTPHLSPNIPTISQSATKIMIQTETPTTNQSAVRPMVHLPSTTSPMNTVCQNLITATAAPTQATLVASTLP